MRIQSKFQSLFLISALLTTSLIGCKGGGGGGGTTAPAVPSTIDATGVAGDQIDVSWGSSFGARLGAKVKDGDFTPVNLNAEKGYSLQRAEDVDGAPGDFVEIASIPTQFTEYSDTSLDDGKQYWYRILAGNAGAKSAFTAAVPGVTVMNAPTNLSAVATGPNQIDLTWDDNSVTEEEVIIERAPDDNGSPGTFAALGTAPADATSFSDTTVKNSSRYHYRVSGSNKWTTSDPSGNGDDKTGWSTANDAGSYHNLAIRSDNTVWGWGSNWSGQLGDGTMVDSPKPVQVSGITTATQVEAAYESSAALLSNGKVMTWGDNSYGQLGDGTNNQSSTPVEVTGLTDVIQIAAQDYSFHALKSDGTVWGWGYNSDGNLGDGTNTDSNVPVQVSGLTDATAIGNGHYHGLAIKNDLTVWAWGMNSNGQLGDGTNTDSNVPVQATGVTGAQQVDGGAYHSVVLHTDGTASAFGYNGDYQLGDGTNTDSNTAVTVLGLTNAVEVSCGYYSNIAHRGNDTQWGWGGNYSGELATGDSTNVDSPVKILSGEIFASLKVGYYGGFGIRQNGDISSWGSNYSGILGNGVAENYDTPQLSPVIDNIIKVSAGEDHCAAIKNDNTLWVWGDNNDGELGNGNTSSVDQAIPIQVAGLPAIIDVAASDGFTVALGSDGLVRTWGDNSDGQLGDGTTTDSSIPLTVPGLSNIIQVAAGENHSMALKSDGTVWTWGDDSDGQIGDGGTNTDQYSPVMVGGLANITMIAAGEDHSMALRNDGTVWTWGEDIDGQLGDGGTDTDMDTPVQATGLNNIIHIAAGFEQSYAVKNDGTAWAWGENLYGQLGDGTNTDAGTAVQVSGITTAVFISGGEDTAYAILNDGTAMGWGQNGQGQIGDGDMDIDKNTPVAISGLSDVTAISGSVDGDHALALVSGGMMYGWGANSEAEIGQGFGIHFFTPQMVIAPPVP